jgi:hypothetical protein
MGFSSLARQVLTPWIESEDQEYMNKAFATEPSSDSFAAAAVESADPLSSGLFFTATGFHGKNRSRA